MKDYLLRIPMQFFAEDGGTGSTGGDTGSSTGGTSNTPADGQNGSTGSNGDSQANKGTGETTPSLDQLIQSAVDRATNKLGNENKKLKSQLDDLIKQKMTDEERIELERKQEREQFEAEKAQFLEEKHKLFAVNALAKADLSIEADKLPSLISLVMGSDENTISENVKNLSDVVKNLVAAKVEQTFKENGRSPSGSGNAGGKDENKGNTIAEQLGKQRAEQEKKSREILDKFTRR